MGHHLLCQWPEWNNNGHRVFQGQGKQTERQVKSLWVLSWRVQGMTEGDVFQEISQNPRGWHKPSVLWLTLQVNFYHAFLRQCNGLLFIVSGHRDILLTMCLLQTLHNNRLSLIL